MHVLLVPGLVSGRLPGLVPGLVHRLDSGLASGQGSAGLTARTAGHAMATGWRSRGDDVVTVLPLPDGAEGLIDAVSTARGGDSTAWGGDSAARDGDPTDRGGELIPVNVPDPFGVAVPAVVFHVAGPSTDASGARGGTAYVEASQVVGPAVVEATHRRAAAREGTSEGVGHLLRAALETGAGRVVVGVGESTVLDCGAGLLRGLGLRGRRLGLGGAGLECVESTDLDGIDGLRRDFEDRDVVVACSDDIPLVGAGGACATAARRSQVDAMDAQQIDRGVGRFADLVERAIGTDLPPRKGLPLAVRPADAERRRRATRSYSGSGGGVAFALAALGGRLVDGASFAASEIGLARAVGAAELVVVAVPRLDHDAAQRGVVPAVGAAALAYGVPVVVVAGEVDLARRELARLGVVGAYPPAGPAGPFATGAWSADADLPAGPGREARRLAERVARVAATWSRPDERGAVPW